MEELNQKPVPHKHCPPVYNCTLCKEGIQICNACTLEHSITAQHAGKCSKRSEWKGRLYVIEQNKETGQWKFSKEGPVFLLPVAKQLGNISAGSDSSELVHFAKKEE